MGARIATKLDVGSVLDRGDRTRQERDRRARIHTEKEIAAERTALEKRLAGTSDI